MTTASAGGFSIALLLISGCGAENATDETSATTPGAQAWNQVSYVKASNPIEGEQFGFAIALSGDGRTLAASAPMNANAASGVTNGPATNDDSSYGSGAVYLYTRTGEDWLQQSFVKASNNGINDRFGSALAISGDGNTLAVSAIFEDGGGTGIDADQSDNSVNESGAVYVFTRSGETWSQTAYIKASNTGDILDGDTFGYSIGLSSDGNTLAVGAPGEDSAAARIDGDETDNSAMAAGAVYVFARDGGEWPQQAYIKNSNNTAGALFGYSVALDGAGDTLAASAYDEDAGSGALYLFTRNRGEWSEEARLQASNTESQDSMGVWIGISDDGRTVAAGAPDEDSFLTGVSPGGQGEADQETNTSAGAVYVFARDNGAWVQQAFIKASNTGFEDWFGVRLAISGDGNTLAVASPNEDSAAQGLGGNQDDDSAAEAGAVYTYTRNGGSWSHEAYLKGSNTVQFDEFGSALALDRSGTILAVGARFEDGARTGTNGGAAGNPVSDSGAVYAFSRQ